MQSVRRPLQMQGKDCWAWSQDVFDLFVLSNWQTFVKEAAFCSFQVRMALLPSGSFWQLMHLCMQDLGLFKHSRALAKFLLILVICWDFGQGYESARWLPCWPLPEPNRGSVDANGVCPILGVVSMVDSQENSTRGSHQRELNHRRSILLLWVPSCQVPRLLVFIQVNQPQFNYRN
jgi:hypothetical protein